MTSDSASSQKNRPVYNRSVYLGLDLGTSALKALLIDEDQRILGSESVALNVSNSAPGWSEQDPADWISACEQAIGRLRDRLGFTSLSGIGLSGHMHGATLIGDDGRPLRPCILWNDTRAQKQANGLDGDPRFRDISGNIVFAGFTAPKVLWVAENEPEVFSGINKVLIPKDYLRLWLTGECVSEMSDASGTGWFDTGKRCWSNTLLTLSRMREDQMPRLVEGSEISGELRPQLARQWGVEKKVVVAGGAGDNAATAIGAGIIRPGKGFVSLGTSGVLFAATDSYRPNPDSAVHTFCHALPGTWHQMGVILAAASALTWWGKLLGENPATLTASLETGGGKLQPPSKEIFLPYLSGERTPHNDGDLRASISGLSSVSDRRTLTRAILEGVAYALKDNQAALMEAGTSSEPLLAMGGGSHSRYWLKVIATVLQVPILRPREGDFGASLGAARLGLLSLLDPTGKDVEKICHSPEIVEEILPNQDLSAAFVDGYRRFKERGPKQR